jgi:ATP-binding cassette subfamily B protein
MKLLEISEKIFKLLELGDENFKKNSIIICFFNFINIFLELITIGSLFPLMILLLDQELFIEKISKYIDISFIEINDLFMIVSLIIFFIIFIKMFTYIFINYYKFNYLSKIQLNLSKTLLKRYLESDYLLFYNKNSGTIINNIKTEHERLNILIGSLYDILTEIFLIGIILVLIIFVDFNKSILFIGFLFIFSLILSSLTKSKSKIWGDERSRKFKFLYQNLVDLFKGFRTIKIYGNLKQYLDYYISLDAKIVSIDKKSKTIFLIPKIFFEFIIITAFLILIYFLRKLNLESSNIILILSFYFLCSSRLIPSISKVHYLSQNIKFLINSFYNIYDENFINRSLNKQTKNCIFKKNLSDFLLELKNVSFSYSRNEENILDDINIKILKNDKILIIGKSGSGKSTFLDILSLLLPHTSGKFFLNSRFFKDKKNFYKKISHVDQNSFLMEGSIKENILFGSKIYEKATFEHALEVAQINSFTKNKKLSNDTLLGEGGSKISGGEKQRVAIARAILKKPDLFIMDEPTSALDFNTEKKIITSLIKNFKDKAIIIVTHKLGLIKYFDKVYEIKNGKLKRYER